MRYDISAWDECRAGVLACRLVESFRMNTRRFFHLAPVVMIALRADFSGCAGAIARNPDAARPRPPPRPRPAAPVAPAPAAPATPAPATPPPAAEAPAAPPAAPAPVQTADPFGDEITLTPKTAVILKGSANWDSAFETLIDSFKKISALLDKQGIKPSGNSMIVYTSTDDNGFTYPGGNSGRSGAEEPAQGHQHRQDARGQGPEIRPSRLLRQHGQHL